MTTYIRRRTPAMPTVELAEVVTNTEEIPLLPTPLAREADGGVRFRGSLTRAVEEMPLLATPNAHDADHGPQDPKKRRAGGHMVNLQDQAVFEITQVVEELL